MAAFVAGVAAEARSTGRKGQMAAPAAEGKRMDCVVGHTTIAENAEGKASVMLVEVWRSLDGALCCIGSTISASSIPDSWRPDPHHRLFLETGLNPQPPHALRTKADVASFCPHTECQGAAVGASTTAVAFPHPHTPF